MNTIQISAKGDQVMIRFPKKFDLRKLSRLLEQLGLPRFPTRFPFKDLSAQIDRNDEIVRELQRRGSGVAAEILADVNGKLRELKAGTNA